MPPPTPVPSVIIEKVARALCGAVSKLTERRQVSVVVYRDLLADARHHERAYIHAGERKVRAELHRLTQKIDLRRQADTDTGYLAGVSPLCDLLDERNERVDDRERPAFRRKHLGVFGDTSLAFDESYRDARTTYIDADRIRRAHVSSLAKWCDA